MDNKQFNEAMEEAVQKAMLEKPNHWIDRRSHWDEWGSPVGLLLSWALFIVPLGLFLWLLHLAGLIG